MFVMQDPEPYPWPVTIRHPDPETPGRWFDQTFTARFRAVTADEAKDLFDLRDDAAVVRDVLVGWDGIVDTNKAEIPFSSTIVERLVADLRFAQGVAQAWGLSVQPTAAQARAMGNSAPSHRRGRLDA